MPVTKPTTLPEWADGGSAAITTPGPGTIATGFIPNQPAMAQYANWLFFWIYKWILWLADIANQPFTWTAAHVFNLGVSMLGSLAVAGTTNLGTTTTGALTANSLACNGAAALGPSGNNATFSGGQLTLHRSGGFVGGGFTNTLHDYNIPKAIWSGRVRAAGAGCFSDFQFNAGGPNLQGSGTLLTLSLFNPMHDDTGDGHGYYAVNVTIGAAGFPYTVCVTQRAVSAVQIAFYNNAGVAVNLSALPYEMPVMVTVFGRQTA